MKATKDYISLETAKLLKDCGIDCPREYRIEAGREIVIIGERYPAFTWQEILWEYPEEFFGKKIKAVYAPLGLYNYADHKHIVASNIMRMLQQKRYDEADLYFRENCILIKKL